MKSLVSSYKHSHLGSLLPAYDGRESLYSWKERKFIVVIKFASHADMHHLRSFLEGKHAEVPQEALNALDIVMRQSPTSRYIPVKQSLYSRELGEQTIGGGLAAHRGFYQSLRPTQMGLSLNIV
ncbi:hypothetical protein HHK36_024144 [Tetracentron sinense]|uniref:Argonaute linker 1 domain-containing protein n=1 Tax=Tetracentron sinense TaxID=13715 RepID=A0A834YMR5_TETSI|nr:hypothetical protein HHK36_024144 [Tetracentron sinense]